MPNLDPVTNGRNDLAAAVLQGRPFATRKYDQNKFGKYLVGWDVSHHQTKPEAIDWSVQDVAIVRAAYGATADRLCAAHVAAAHGAGVPLIGAYLFVVQHRTAEEQLETFRSVTKGLPLNVAPTIDVEWESTKRGLKRDVPKLLEIAKFIHDALAEEHTHCMVYSAPGYIKDVLGMPKWLLQAPLWLAHYTTPGEPVTWGFPEFDRWCGHQWRGAPLDANVWMSVPLSGRK